MNNLTARIKNLLVITVFIILVSSCQNPLFSLLGGKGSLNITIYSSESSISRSLDVITYKFYGSGPDDETFYKESESTSITVDNLATGDWTIEVEGYTADESLVLFGETSIYVINDEENELELSLNAVSGDGSLLISVQWAAEYTVDPSVIAVIKDKDGNETDVSIDCSGGVAEAIVDNLASGYYTVSLRLYDSVETVSGGTWTVRVLKLCTSIIETVFNNLNKVGECITITAESFLIAWECADGGANEFYNVYYRNRGTLDWILLEQIKAEASPQLQITTSKLTYGVYEFAVSSLVTDGESGLHASMDDDADPVSGWYVDWQES